MTQREEESYTDEEWRQQKRSRAIGVKHELACAEESCGGVYRCWRCNEFVGWCQGTDDDAGLCADCWVELHAEPPE